MDSGNSEGCVNSAPYFIEKTSSDPFFPFPNLSVFFSFFPLIHHALILSVFEHYVNRFTHKNSSFPLYCLLDLFISLCVVFVNPVFIVGIYHSLFINSIIHGHLDGFLF